MEWRVAGEGLFYISGSTAVSHCATVLLHALSYHLVSSEGIKYECHYMSIEKNGAQKYEDDSEVQTIS